MLIRTHILLFLQVGHMFRISMLGSILADHIICEPLTPFLSCTSSLPVGEFRRACGQGGAEEGGESAFVRGKNWIVRLQNWCPWVRLACLFTSP